MVLLVLLVALGTGPLAYHWYSIRTADLIRGYILEGCSCKVPCPCNVGHMADPVPICEALAFFQIEEGRLGGTALRGVRFAIAGRAGISSIVYLNGSQSPAQELASRKLAAFILASERTPISQTAVTDIQVDLSEQHPSAHAGDSAKLTGELLFDSQSGKPEIVRHPKIYGSFPFAYAEKGRTNELSFRSNIFSFSYSGTNLNRGYFEIAADKLKSE